MAEKRRDKKNRILHNGESQRADGRYRYKYVDELGKERSVYSWKLVASDRIPEGKRECEPLRELERQIQADLRDKVVPLGGGMTVVELCEKYLLSCNGFRENTKANHRTSMNVIRNTPFGAMRIDQIRVLDAKMFLVMLQKEQDRSYSSIQSIRGVLRPAFRLAYESEYIRRNPFDFPLKDVLVNDSVTRDAISREQQRKFLKFIKEDKHFSEYYDPINLLFKTGMRISEFCGLRIEDIDMDNRTINIAHQLQRKRDGTLYVLEDDVYSGTTKTTAGKRCIPMLDDAVFRSFENIINNRIEPDVEPEVDGYTDFLILNFRVKKGVRPMVAMDWEHIFKRIITKYNSIYKEELPAITPHVCRHTCCNNLANKGMSPAQLQFYMGHSDISVTMKNYVHTKTDDVREEINRLRKSRKTGTDDEW